MLSDDGEKEIENGNRDWTDILVHKVRTKEALIFLKAQLSFIFQSGDSSPDAHMSM